MIACRWAIRLATLIVTIFPTLHLHAQESKPRQIALVVGVRQYPRGVLGDLNFTDNDAEDLGAWLRDKGGFDVVTVMTQPRGAKDTDLLPTKRNIERNLDEILKLVRPRRGDRIVVALSGHGIEYPDQQAGGKTEAFFCPADVEKSGKRFENLVSLKSVYKKLDDSDADVKVLVVDACREVKADKGGAEDFSPPHPPKGIAAFFSCRSDQKSFEYEKDKPDQPRHGLFVYRFLEALNGAGAKDGKVTLETLAAYVKETVPVDAKSVISVKANQDPHIVIDTIGKPVVLATLPAFSDGNPSRSSNSVRISAKAPKPLRSPFTKEEAKAAQQAWARYLGKKIEEEIDIGGGAKMVFELIPPGTFKMGVSEEQLKQLKSDGVIEASYERATPCHEVTITKPFYMGKYSVTQGEYVQLTGRTNPSYHCASGSGKQWVGGLDTNRFPVESVSWSEAAMCASALEKKLGLGWVTARLPSEAMWEYSCRAGTETLWNLGNHFNLNRILVDEHFGTVGLHVRTGAVGFGTANGFSLYDMHVNVRQWCSSSNEKYTSAAQIDPDFTGDGSVRVTRGGITSRLPYEGWSAYRGWHDPEYRGSFQGVRLALIPSSLASSNGSDAHASNENRVAAGQPKPLKAPFTKVEARTAQQAWAKYLGKKVEEQIDIGGDLKIVFELIPPGTFQMGSPSEELKLEGDDKANDNETPNHEVTITKPFYMGKYTVTQGEYGQLTGKANPSYFSARGDGKAIVAGLDTSRFPVETVSWDDAVGCASALQMKLGPGWLKARLPSEAMWEHACRAGTVTRWNVGNQLTGNDANFGQSALSGRTRAVGGGPTNGFGLYDMHGNVWQWCSDAYQEKYTSAAQIDPEHSGDASSRIFRGGCWYDSARLCRSATRLKFGPTLRQSHLGFRLVLIPSDVD